MRLDLKVNGQPSVTSEPPLPSPGDHVYLPTTTTRFHLTVRRWLQKDAVSETEVRVMAGALDAEPDEISIPVTCQENRLVGSLERLPAEWDRRLRVARVESGEDRELRIVHEGREARLSPQDPATSAFADTGAAGTWAVSAPLGPAERCDATPAPPDLLTIAAHLRCGS